MSTKLLRLPFGVTRYLFHQNSAALRFLDFKISSKYCQASSFSSDFSKFEKKSSRKKKKSSSKNKIASAKVMNPSEVVGVKDHILSPEEIAVGKAEEFSDYNVEFNEISDSIKETDLFQIKIEEKKCKNDSNKKLKKKISNEKSTEGMNVSLLNEKERKLELLKDSQQNGRLQSFNHSLASYISVSIFCGYFKNAFDTYEYYKRFTPETFPTKIMGLKPYNEILKGIANQGDLKMMKKFLNDIKASSLKPDYNTIAYCLTCLGRNIKLPSVVCEIDEILKLMNDHGITLDEIFSYASFCGESLQYCVQAVEMVIPNIKEELNTFNPTKDFFIKQNCYDNHIVNDLNDSIFMKQENSPIDGVISREKLSELIQEQVNVELKGYVEIPTICEDKITDEGEKNKKLFNDWNVHWRKVLTQNINAHVKFMTVNFHNMKSQPINYFPYFNVLDTEEIVDLLMLEVNNLCMVSETYSSSFSHLAIDFGKKFYQRFLIKYKEKTQFLPALIEAYEKYCQWYLNPSDPDASYIPRVQWKNIQSKMIHKTNFKDTCLEWPYTVHLAIGKILYNFIVSSVKVWGHEETEEDATPAFYKVHRYYESKTKDEIKPSPILTEVLKGTNMSNSIKFSTTMLPMLSPPVPWSDLKNGGYVMTESDFIRVLPHVRQQKQVLEEGGKQKLFPVMDSINTLGSLPWKINCNMLDLIIKVFNNGGWEELGISPPPSSVPNPPKLSPEMSTNERKEIFRTGIELKKRKKELNSLWCDTLYKLSLANYYRNSVIWLPQNMDFRGRTYPVPPHVTHVSADLFRSILCFAQGKKLGKEGIFWLKLHIINLTGTLKRCGIEDRLKFCEEIMDEIFDSAKNPLDGNKWWAKSDEPWQTLAACKDLVAALESECPEDYVSHIPIHQDGSCNGLQHYAALGRDKEGGASVNLCSFDKPQDVYSRIVDLIEEGREKDAENGLKIAKDLEGFITRKVIKQTVMTTVYGVTRYGARLQILKQLKDLENFPVEHQHEASHYLTKKTFESLGTLFTATKTIQYWLVKVAEGISKNCLQNVGWETPLGFSVIQPYMKNKPSNHVQGQVIRSYNSDIISKPNVLKQKNGFAPNFIHSLDASHMMLTSLYCRRAGIAFASVHDCFWTHASSVREMNKICREEFVKLHSEPILENLAQFITDKYSSNEEFYTCNTSLNSDSHQLSLHDLLQKVPEKGELDINEVLRSVFFFS